MVSVCVTTYQHEEFIEHCLNGILQQKTSFPFELLIGEDESEDKTREICKKYAEDYPDKIRLFLRDRKTSQLYDNEGNYLCRFNGKWLGLSLRGKYIALCEGDDYWTDEYKLQKQIDFLEAHPDYSMCFHNAKVIYTYKPETRNFVNLKEGEYSGVDLYARWLVPTASVVFAINSIVDEGNFLNSKFYFEDVILILTLADAGRIWYIDEVMSVYRKHEGGMTHKVFESSENVRKFIAHQKQILQIFPKKYKKSGYKNISWYYFSLFKITFKENFTESVTSLAKSFFYSPRISMYRFRRLLGNRGKSK